ncbi:MAG: diguanylate cyclase domain-containing protein [Solirubrobacteraceae bacterium]
MTSDAWNVRVYRVAPFAGAAVLAWASAIVGSSINWTVYGTSCVLLLLAGVLRTTVPWRITAGGVSSSLVFLAAVAMLRSSAGGINSGVGIVSLIPVFYASLYSRKALQLYVVLAGVAVFDLAPILLVGPPEFPQSQYRAALLTVAVSSIIGLATRHLVAEVRRQAAQARKRERMLQQVNELVRNLSRSRHARAEICEAARTIGEASVSALFEPVCDKASTLRATATAGLDIGPVEVSHPRSAIIEAFTVGQSLLITENIESHLGSREMWEAAGRPVCVLYEPLLRGSETVGVLAVGWAQDVRADSSRATIVALLAHEAEVMIDRADELSKLTDMASTDPLTGLPNRRAWDAHVNQALSGDRPFTIAMFDLDHFKEFNDTYGHPAGDRLLRETAARWREQLRSGDLLARLGGEEFGLLLLDCDSDLATDVIERLRGQIYRQRTCSAGFAAWRPGESAEQVTARADAALYEAKQSGRDRMCMSA